jgi:hypothetical protein
LDDLQAPHGSGFVQGGPQVGSVDLVDVDSAQDVFTDILGVALLDGDIEGPVFNVGIGTATEKD